MRKLSDFSIVLLFLVGIFCTRLPLAAESNSLIVYKHPLCFCCKKWVRHLQSQGVDVEIRYRTDMGAVKGRWGIPQGMTGCHTAVWQDTYVFEGHVPAKYIRKFLHSPPAESLGLAVPGMPLGSPGMYNGKTFEPYNIYLILPDGDYRFFARVESPESLK